MSDEIERDAFDLVHCQLLLHHLRGKQVEAVRRIASTLRLGGIFIASECYLGAMRASSTRAFAELWRGLYAALPNADYEWRCPWPRRWKPPDWGPLRREETSAWSAAQSRRQRSCG
jgi:SAM-dependent methyltransferase